VEDGDSELSPCETKPEVCDTEDDSNGPTTRGLSTENVSTIEATGNRFVVRVVRA
jgi:hypothetical protein